MDGLRKKLGYFKEYGNDKDNYTQITKDTAEI